MLLLGQKFYSDDRVLLYPVNLAQEMEGFVESSSQAGAGKTLVAQTTLQNVEVAGTGLWTPPGTAQSENNQGVKIITFALDHQEALILKYIKDSGGTIDLVVRAFDDNQNVDTDPVNIDYLVDTYHFIGLPQNQPKK